MKKPFYKKWWVWLIAIFVLFIMIGACSNKDKDKKTSEPTKTETKKSDSSNPKDKITNEAESIAKGLMGTSIKKIEVNEHAGTDNPDDYILLLHLSFDTKNTKQTTKEMIEDHNNEIGVKVAKELKNVQEVAVFWEAPYIKKGDNIVKANLERSGDKMMFKENWIAPVLK
ncbi:MULTISPECIES: hypothetical protein [Bacillus]|uniref:hypothetical protein n=1 Tax=Bacillus TaxID=1386 RepID=UPI0022E3623F|nr:MULTISPECIES: hypothetical protein [Bacillus]MDA1690224.1 hypothetical protein [Bacillus cereus group sp. TH147LC]MDK7546443.1 hypothetical protein [Bacillus pacificus]MDK7550539.1 hypothetical protein [Bacillus pacificus]MDK7566085.1 hypothetical protein [Bacillus pacificus]MDK7579260.1 hypothetical protein [Bacillus pacificus]